VDKFQTLVEMLRVLNEKVGEVQQQNNMLREARRKDSLVIHDINNKIGKLLSIRFKRPTFKEVEAYCQERKNQVDPQRFLDHYDAIDWFRGKNKIKDWKACVRTWENNSKGEGYESSLD